MKIILYMVIILSCRTFPLYADEADNLGQLEVLYQSLLDSLLSRHPVSDTIVVISPSGTVQPINWLIDKEINQALRKHGAINVFDSAAGQSPMSARMEYQSLVCDIRYEKVDKIITRRKVSVQLYLKYVAANGSVPFADIFQRIKTDNVRKKIDQLENINLPFTQGEHASSLVSRLAEPLAASLLTGMIILLFYFYRSH